MPLPSRIKRRASPGGPVSPRSSRASRRLGRRAQPGCDDALDRLFELGATCVWEQDAQLRFVCSSGQPFGSRERAAWLGRHHWDIAGLQPQGGSWDEHRRAVTAHRPFRNLETVLRDAGGTLRHFCDSGEPIINATGRFCGYRGFSREVTYEVVDRRLLQLEHDITHCIAQAESLNAAVVAVMRLVCRFEHWECGDYWWFDRAAGVRRLLFSWGMDSPPIQRFIERCKGMVLPLEEGNVGQVFRTGQPFWKADMRTHTVSVRTAAANEAGLRGLFIMPVVSGGSLIGAITFNSRQVRQADQRVLDAFAIIGTQMGEYLGRKHAEDVMRDSEARFRALTELSSDWYWEEDLEGRFTRMEGQGAAKMTHYVGRRPEELGFIAEAGWNAYYAARTAQQPFRDLIMQVQAGSETRFLSVSGAPIFDADGRCTGYRGVTRDISHRRQDEERIRYLAMNDGLTGLPNRVAFAQLLTHALESARRYERRFAVLFIDLDRFKTINDSLGHDAGDRLLCEVSQRIRSTLRSSDVVARLGGDEFVVLLQEVACDADVTTACRKILSTVIQPMTLLGQECRVTASVGISMFPADAQDEASLMKHADIAMYQAKEAGKNTFHFYNGESKSRALEKMTLEAHLRQAVERGEFALHYQAQLDLASNRIVGVEALLRWNCPALGPVSPAQFIPLAEETGLIVPIGKWVLRTACHQAMAWQRSGLPPICVAVNLSPRQFSDPDLLDDLADALRTSGLAPSLLELEITEGMVMRDTQRTIDLLSAIKALGVNLAIDDFGTGYSSLAQLRRFPINTLKVDRSFIREITHNAGDKAITEAIINMGRSLSLTVVAEGVETAEQMELLRGKCCDQIQGFHFSKPLTPGQFAELLRRHDARPVGEAAASSCSQ